MSTHVWINICKLREAFLSLQKFTTVPETRTHAHTHYALVSLALLSNCWRFIKELNVWGLHQSQKASTFIRWGWGNCSLFPSKCLLSLANGWRKTGAGQHPSMTWCHIRVCSWKWCHDITVCWTDYKTNQSIAYPLSFLIWHSSREFGVLCLIFVAILGG